MFVVFADPVGVAQNGDRLSVVALLVIGAAQLEQSRASDLRIRSAESDQGILLASQQLHDRPLPVAFAVGLSAGHRVAEIAPELDLYLRLERVEPVFLVGAHLTVKSPKQSQDWALLWR